MKPEYFIVVLVVCLSLIGIMIMNPPDRSFFIRSINETTTTTLDSKISTTEGDEVEHIVYCEFIIVSARDIFDGERTYTEKIPVCVRVDDLNFKSNYMDDYFNTLPEEENNEKFLVRIQKYGLRSFGIYGKTTETVESIEIYAYGGSPVDYEDGMMVLTDTFTNCESKLERVWIKTEKCWGSGVRYSMGYDRCMDILSNEKDDAKKWKDECSLQATVKFLEMINVSDRWESICRGLP